MIGLSPAVRDELRNVVFNYPVFAGDTISHGTMQEVANRGWAVRNAGGDWIPTAAGIEAWAAMEGGAR